MEMKSTNLEGYPIQYDYETVKPLNFCLVFNGLNNIEIKIAGEKVPRYTGHALRTTTDDNYVWFSRLEYKIDDSDVVILFPWKQNFQNLSELDRSVNVYSNGILHPEQVKGLLEILCTELEKEAGKRPERPVF